MKLFNAVIVLFTIILFIGCSKFVPIYDGKTLNGWKIPEGDNGHWKVVDGIINYDGKSEASGDKNLWTEKEYSDFILKIDWRLPREPVETEVPVVLPDGKTALNEDGTEKTVKVMDAGDSGIYLRGTPKCQLNIWSWPIGSGEVYGYRTDKTMSPDVVKGVTPIKNADNSPGEWNTFIATMKNEYLTVVLNGETVLDNAHLPGVPLTGPIALQHHTDPVQFRNIYIKELK
ncbi:DUF1080 domain-containing protein [candidate division KSB1 bacterium]